MRGLWLFVLLGACSGDDGSGTDTTDAGVGGNVTWTWTFIDPATSSVATCPVGVPTVNISAWGFAGGGENGNGYTNVGGGSFACDAGMGVMSLPVGSFQIIVQPDRGGLAYAELHDQVTVEAGVPAQGHTDITIGRGFPHVTWTVLNKSTMQWASCPADTMAIVASSLAAHVAYPCSVGSATLPGQEAGTRAIGLDMGRQYPNGWISYGFATVNADIVADAVTEVPVMLTLP